MTREKIASAIVSRLESEFPEIVPGKIAMDTDFSEAMAWDSIHIMVLLFVIEEETGILLSYPEIKDLSNLSLILDRVEIRKNGKS